MAERSKVRESAGRISEEIETAIRRDSRERAGIDRSAQEFAEDVRDHWRSIAPVRTGAYAASIHVERRPNVDGMAARSVVASDFKAHWIEYGTGADTKQGSRLGPDTPTPTYAPAAKTAAFFGGTDDGGGAE